MPTHEAAIQRYLCKQFCLFLLFYPDAKGRRKVRNPANKPKISPACHLAGGLRACAQRDQETHNALRNAPWRGSRQSSKRCAIEKSGCSDLRKRIFRLLLGCPVHGMSSAEAFKRAPTVC